MPGASPRTAGGLALAATAKSTRKLIAGPIPEENLVIAPSPISGGTRTLTATISRWPVMVFYSGRPASSGTRSQKVKLLISKKAWL